MPRLRGLKPIAGTNITANQFIVRIKMPRLRGLKPIVCGTSAFDAPGKNQNAPIEGIETRHGTHAGLQTSCSKNQNAPIEGIETEHLPANVALKDVVRIKMPRLRGLKLQGVSCLSASTWK